MPITAPDVLTFIYILIGVMLVAVLYHVLFVVVDLRKIVRRVEGITSEVEGVIMKPLSMADQILQWVLDKVQSKKHEKREFSHKKVD